MEEWPTEKLEELAREVVDFDMSPELISKELPCPAHYVLACNNEYGISYVCYGPDGKRDGPSIFISPTGTGEPTVTEYAYYENGVPTNGIVEKIYSNRAEYHDARSGEYLGLGYRAEVFDSHSAHFSAMNEAIIKNAAYNDFVSPKWGDPAPITFLRGRPIDALPGLMDMPVDSVWVAFSLPERKILEEGPFSSAEAFTNFHVPGTVGPFGLSEDRSGVVLVQLDKGYEWYSLRRVVGSWWKVRGADCIEDLLDVERGRAADNEVIIYRSTNAI